MLFALFEPIVDFIFPPRCPLCGQAVRSHSALCSECWSGLRVPGEPCCTLCSRPFDDGIVMGSQCGPCLANPPRHAGIAAATLYNEPSRELVLAFKHGRRLGLAPLMAKLMASKLEDMAEDDWVVVPVPLHRWRLWIRGYNQAALLAREVVRMKGGQLAVDALSRRKSTSSLGGLGRLERKRELSGAIQISRKGKAVIRGKNILLVDDVLTSGATSDACVSALLRGGAAKVVIACFARVVTEA